MSEWYFETTEWVVDGEDSYNSRSNAMNSKMKRGGAVRCAIGVVFFVAAVAILYFLERNTLIDCVWPSACIGIGLAFIKSRPYLSNKSKRMFIDTEGVIKGLLGGFFGPFIVLLVICYGSKLMESFFGVSF